jgi:hypothetical protein
MGQTIVELRAQVRRADVTKNLFGMCGRVCIGGFLQQPNPGTCRASEPVTSDVGYSWCEVRSNISFTGRQVHLLVVNGQGAGHNAFLTFQVASDALH